MGNAYIHVLHRNHNHGQIAILFDPYSEFVLAHITNIFHRDEIFITANIEVKREQANYDSFYYCGTIVPTIAYGPSVVS